MLFPNKANEKRQECFFLVCESNRCVTVCVCLCCSNTAVARISKKQQAVFPNNNNKNGKKKKTQKCKSRVCCWLFYGVCGCSFYIDCVYYDCDEDRRRSPSVFPRSHVRTRDRENIYASTNRNRKKKERKLRKRRVFLHVCENDRLSDRRLGAIYPVRRVYLILYTGILDGVHTLSTLYIYIFYIYTYIYNICSSTNMNARQHDIFTSACSSRNARPSLLLPTK